MHDNEFTRKTLSEYISDDNEIVSLSSDCESKNGKKFENEHTTQNEVDNEFTREALSA